MEEFKKKLLNRIGVMLSDYGFKAKLADQAFLRNFPFGKLSCHVSFIDHEDDFDVTADVAIRFDALEEIVNEDSHLSKAMKYNTFSIGCDIGNLTSGEQHRWSFFQDNDIESVAKSVVDYFIRFGLPYFEKYSNMEKVFDLISSNPERPCLHSPFLDNRAKQAVALALLLGKEKRIPKIVEDFEEQLKLVYPHGLLGFKDFTARLHSKNRISLN